MRTKIEDLEPVFRIRIRRIRMFLGFPDLDPLDRDTVPDPASALLKPDEAEHYATLAWSR